MKLSLALALAVALSGSACVTVQTRVTADVLVETAGGHAHYRYEATASHDTAGLAIACVATAIWYGGACWAYLAAPFDAQEQIVLEQAKRDVAQLGACAHLLNPRVEASGWNTGGGKARIMTVRGESMSIDDAARLCSGARVTTPGPAPSPPASPPATSPPATAAPPEPWDPANP